MNSKLVIDLKKKRYPNHAGLINQLVEMNYNRVYMVLEPGEFTVRGSIIDIYAVNHSHPIRIEYLDNDIERLNSFNIHNQRSISKIVLTEIVDAKAKEGRHFFADAPDSAADQLLSDIQSEDAVVHEDYGIGLFKGLTRLTIAGREGEYWLIQYKGSDKLYVPLEQISRLSKYSHGELTPKLNALSDGSWTRIKNRAKKAVEELAEDIYIMQKIRSSKLGFSFAEDTVWQIDLEESFPHVETPDQLTATEEVKQDMESVKPMDRLICGDVGYGKTEIVIRAAFKACENHKQIAVLVPTTILADQHFHTFSDRFKPFHYTVEVLSRFKSKAEQRDIIQSLKAKQIDVIIGTHRLLQKDVQFADLGLLVIDEEQRFGVTHKERLKQLKHNVDIITITATPIPRTLYMSLTGAKDISILETPPKLRKPVLTQVNEYHDSIVQHAIQNEINRGGQVYYLFNNIQKMPQKLAHLKSLMPNVQFGFAHGQMHAHQLEAVFHDFFNNKFQVLLCTTIIENGLDILNVNTTIIDEAQNLGLAQIHQLRGRVGRTERQAYAYLLYPQAEVLSEKSRKRLQAIREYASLGAGYKLALKDLEIRGGGTLLGQKQHGHMTAVGFDLYCKLLAESVHRSQDKPIQEKPVIILDKSVRAFIPEEYISNPRERMAIYKRIMAFEHPQQCDDLLDELKDRYGQTPLIVIDLFDAVRQQV